jgi:MoxR-like ATPase
MNGRYNVSYSDINELALPVLRHRIKLTFEAAAERISADEIVNMIVAELIDRCKIAAEKPAVKAKAVAAPADVASETEEVVEDNTKKRGLFGRK